MSLIYEERSSGSPYVALVMRGHTLGDGAPVRPAETHWHMVFVKQNGSVRPLVVGPWTSSGITSWTAGAELLWIKFKLGTFMPHLPVRKLRNLETLLPDAARESFWLKGSAWQIPDYENVETFVEWLVRDELLVRDPVVEAALQDQLSPQAISPRTIRHQFLQATGLSQKHIRQVERAQCAAALLQQGVPILDVVHEAGYFDQPHLTRSLKQFIGHTPAQIGHLADPAQNVSQPA